MIVYPRATLASIMTYFPPPSTRPSALPFHLRGARRIPREGASLLLVPNLISFKPLATLFKKLCIQRFTHIESLIWTLPCIHTYKFPYLYLVLLLKPIAPDFKFKHWQSAPFLWKYGTEILMVHNTRRIMHLFFARTIWVKGQSNN